MVSHAPWRHHGNLSVPVRLLAATEAQMRFRIWIRRHQANTWHMHVPLCWLVWIPTQAFGRRCMHLAGTLHDLPTIYGSRRAFDALLLCLAPPWKASMRKRLTRLDHDVNGRQLNRYCNQSYVGKIPPLFPPLSPSETSVWRELAVIDESTLLCDGDQSWSFAAQHPATSGFRIFGR